MNNERYAIYYAPPPRSALWKYGCRWLGWDAYGGERMPLRVPRGLDEADYLAMVETPRKYGFHATLKAPFHLHPDRPVDELVEGLGLLASSHKQIVLPKLVLTSLDGFMALRPEEPNSELDNLAADCVVQLDRFRAPLSEVQIAKRRQSDLTEEQDANLLRWGYPYVLDQYRFHMTLTGRLQESQRMQVQSILKREMEPLLSEPHTIDSLTLFRQAAEDQPFYAIMRFSLVPVSPDESLERDSIASAN